MSIPREPASEQQQASGPWTIALIVLAVLGVAMLTCCGGLGVLGAFFYTRAEKAAAQARVAFQPPVKPGPLIPIPGNPPPVVPAWQSEWIAMAQLTPAYSAAVDAVAADSRVLEKLGEPIEPVNQVEQLFRRQKSGNWDRSDETIEFDIQGPKGKAVVRVLAGQLLKSEMPATFGGMQPKSISVVLEDGTELHVVLPAKDDAKADLN